MNELCKYQEKVFDRLRKLMRMANSKLKVAALGQTYFVIQTRKQEITELEYSKLLEDEKRLYRRKQTKDGNKLIN